MNVREILRTILFGSMVLVVACSQEDPFVGPQTTASSKTAAAIENELTPFQQSVQQRIANRTEAGLPVPVVRFDYVSDNGAPLSALRTRVGAPGESFTITATTTLEFDHPRQAGLDRWPDLVFAGSVSPEEGYIREGDYTQAYKDYIAERVPDVWATYEYGTEPRTQTITETFTVTYADAQQQSKGMVDDDLVHGLTISGPSIDWTVSSSACTAGVCAYYFRAGLAFDWGFGIRLPMNVSLNSTDPVNEGDTFTPTSSAQGVNWSAADYTAAGIAPEDGNEFVMRFEFFLGIQVEVAEVSVISIGPDVDEDASSSFATPFGPGSVFNLPTIDLPLLTRDLAAVALEFGASATPQAGSDHFQANWMASSDLSGSGALMWTNPAIAANLSSVYAIDGPAMGNLQIKDSKYTFNQFKIALGAYFEIDIFGLYDHRYDIPITDFDLSDLIPSVSVPIHAGSSPTTVNSSIQVQNVAPTATLNVAGANLINGIDTFFADVGAEIPFQGTSHDPGRDDLTIVWDFGDGSPSPDRTTDHPLVALTGPNDVVENQPYTYEASCLYQVMFQSTDSDGGTSFDTAAVIIRSADASRARLAGYWQHQFKGNGQVEYSEDELECLLEIVGFVSNVFDEVRNASTVDMAHDVMHLSGNGGSELEKLDRDLLMAWMNFAIGAFDLGTMVDTDGDSVPDTTFASVLAAAETVRLDPQATAMQLQMQRQIVHYVCTQATGENVSPRTPEMVLR